MPETECWQACTKRHSFLNCFLCLSRACLGKTIVFIYNWPKNGVFRTGEEISLSSVVSFHVVPLSLLVENETMGAFAPRPTMTRSTELFPSRLRDNVVLFVEFSLCLSRACLGTRSLMSTNWRNKDHFLVT
jgi:hypothetical protein